MVTVPSEFIPLIDQRLTDEHLPSRSKYVLSLVAFDLMTRCPHTITAQVVTEPENMFSRVVEEIVKNFDTARTKVSGWISKRITEMLADGAKLKVEEETHGPN